MSSITINGKNSYKDFDALLTARSSPPPAIKDISVTIPYRSGDICFTYQNGGKPAYEARTLTYTFLFVGFPKQNLRKRVSEFESWILKAGECIVYDSADIYYYKARPVSCKESEKGYRIEVTVTFKAQPYKISPDYSDIGFDNFNFETDYLNQTAMTLTANQQAPHAPAGVLEVYSYADRPIRPRLSYKRSENDTEGVGFTYFELNGEEVKANVYRKTEKDFDLDELVLKPGLNVLAAYGFGALTLKLYEEVL